MVRTKEEYIKALSDYIGEDTSDAALAIVEDFSDTYDSVVGDGTDWKAKYDELDQEWRRKYKERFFDGTDKLPTGEDKDDNTHEEEKEKELVTYEDFFEDIKVEK